MNKITSSGLLPIRVLIIDDDEDDFMLLRDFIEAISLQSFKIEWSSNYENGLTAFSRSEHDIYFIDYYLGLKTGIDLLKEVLAKGCLEPIILLTGVGSPAIDLDALRSGAFDYLIKSQLSTEQLDRSIRYSIELASKSKSAKSNEQKFRSIFERSKDVIFIANTKLDIITINQASVELCGYRPDELHNLNFSSLLVNAENSSEILMRLTEQKEVVDFKISVLAKDQSTKNCIFSATLEIDQIGASYIQGIIRDISALARIEQIKIQSEKMEAKGVVIRTLAHEIRNPLHNIILSTGYLRNETTNDNLEFLNIIERNSKRIDTLINELMDSNQYYKMKLEIIPLQVILKETLEMALDQIALSNVTLNLICPPVQANALLDKEKIKIAIFNIVINGIEAMPKGLGQLDIRLESTPNFNRIHIKDNGCGMTRENIAKIFEPYFTTKTKGMGLGLAATQSILQSHDASVEVHSVLEEGTTFTITFPAI